MDCTPALTHNIIILTQDDLLSFETTGFPNENINHMLNQGCRLFILDLSSIKNLRSSLLGSVLKFYQFVSRHGGGVSLVNPFQRNRSLLNLTRVSEFTRVCDTVPEAIAGIEPAIHS